MSMDHVLFLLVENVLIYKGFSSWNTLRGRIQSRLKICSAFHPEVAGPCFSQGDTRRREAEAVTSSLLSEPIARQTALDCFNTGCRSTAHVCQNKPLPQTTNFRFLPVISPGGQSLYFLMCICFLITHKSQRQTCLQTMLHGFARSFGSHRDALALDPSPLWL